MNKFYSAIMGFAVGDALGVPFEFLERGTFKATGMTGYGTHNQPPGTWSDDTSMVLATIDSLCDCGSIDLEDMMGNFASWLFAGDFTPHGKVFDVGNTTREAIIRYATTGKIAGGSSEMDNGNGSLMRILPLAFVPGVTTADVYAVSGLTHDHELSKACCEAYVSTVQLLLSGEKIQWRPDDYVRSTGYVLDTLEAALWCVLRTDNYRDCVLTAVNLGGDTDTIAALAGGLAGIMYGVDGIPKEWIKMIARRYYIKSLCAEFDSIFDSVQSAQC